MITTVEISSRLSQLGGLSRVEINGRPLVLHGSIGHAAMMGQALPPELRFNGERRDVDVFVSGAGKIAVEKQLGLLNLNSPAPIDGGMCDLIRVEGGDFYAHKHGVDIKLNETEVLNETETHELPGTNGIEICTPSRIGMLAIHNLGPGNLRLSHLLSDINLSNWFKQQEVKLPKGLQASIDEFHRAYRAAYSHGVFYCQLAKIYVRFVPEEIRSHFRQITHRFMLRHAGRETPFT